MIIIDGINYDIEFIELKRKADFLDKYAERTEDGALKRELIGVYYNYQLSLGKTLNTVEYHRLFRKLSEPVEFHTVTVPDGDSTYTFSAYFSNVQDELVRVGKDGKTYWRGLTVNFIAEKPARTA